MHLRIRQLNSCQRLDVFHSCEWIKLIVVDWMWSLKQPFDFKVKCVQVFGRQQCWTVRIAIVVGRRFSFILDNLAEYFLNVDGNRYFFIEQWRSHQLKCTEILWLFCFQRNFVNDLLEAFFVLYFDRHFLILYPLWLEMTGQLCVVEVLTIKIFNGKRLTVGFHCHFARADLDWDSLCDLLTCRSF